MYVICYQKMFLKCLGDVVVRVLDLRLKVVQSIFTIQSAGGISPASPSTCPTGLLIIAYAPPVFCPFRLRSAVKT